MRLLLRRDAFGGTRNLTLRGGAARNQILPCAPKNLKEPPDEPGLRASGPAPRKGGCGIGWKRHTTDPKRTTSLEAKRKLDCTFRRPEVGEYPWLGTLGRFSAQLGAMNVTDIRRSQRLSKGVLIEMRVETFRFPPDGGRPTRLHRTSCMFGRHSAAAFRRT